jgi:hypothetical protein
MLKIENGKFHSLLYPQPSPADSSVLGLRVFPFFPSSAMNRGNRTRMVFSDSWSASELGRLWIANMYMRRGAEFLTAWLCCRNSIGSKKGLAAPKETG